MGVGVSYDLWLRSCEGGGERERQGGERGEGKAEGERKGEVAGGKGGRGRAAKEGGKEKRMTTQQKKYRQK